VGLRNWAVPIFISWILKLCAAAGISDPLGYRAVIELPQLCLHFFAVRAVYLYASRRVDRTRALVCAALVGLYAPVLTFAGRTMGESFSADFLLIGFELLDRS